MAVDKGQLAQAALEATALEGAERQLCTDLVYGVLRARIRIKRLLGEALAKPDKLPSVMRIALEVAVYSLFFQDRAAAYAVVNETVSLVKSRFGQRMAHVANGALRALLRSGQPVPPASEDSIADWAAFYAMPAFTGALWKEAYGRENAISLLRRSFGRPYSCLRVNQLHPSGSMLLAALHAQPDCQSVGRAGAAFAPGRLPELVLGRDLRHWHKSGVLSWQAAGSQLVLEELGIADSWKNTQVWDACAGFGGKTLALLERGINVGFVSDTSLARLGNIPGECRRLGLSLPNIAVADAAACAVSAWQGNIIADVPCSGLGVLARRPDIKGRISEAALAKAAASQSAIIHKLARYLLPGCELAYITCTLNPTENEKQIDLLCKSIPTLEIVSQWQTPHDHPWLEGMFGSRLRKRSAPQA